MTSTLGQTEAKAEHLRRTGKKAPPALRTDGAPSPCRDSSPFTHQGNSPNAELPVYVQIKNRLRWEILTGAYAEGSHLPSAGELGNTYGANKNTILRALRMLRSEGMIDFGRGRAAVVTRSARPVGLADISEQLQAVVNLADASGIPRSMIISAVQRIPRAASARAVVGHGARAAFT
ncbi:GntR family transcriptional regulator [Streptomyces sp. SID161]|uniref:GntR family transcriptional regulator n=1 Tax=Streptomyces sp. SID161 TaxID=2690251 RepID=UPI0013680C57|nr:GntR family transcriptional regulator [Streptomyces sp. SID161]MYW47975.1 GntR family transcriptional regulator [Streptomyces sp. SID161]